MLMGTIALTNKSGDAKLANSDTEKLTLREKKYQTKRIKELLDRDKDESMAAISQDVIKDFYEWVGDEKQVDDVLLIGIEL